STTQQLRKLVAAPYLSPNDWTPRLDAYFASPLALCARRVSSAASRLLGTTSLRFALHGWQRLLANAYIHEAPYGELLVLRGNALADSEDWITVVHATHPELEQAPANVVSVVQSAQTAAKNDPTLAARIDAHGQIAFDF
uniref:hypothetical protein n=2 Tax=Thiolapillus sp. TaxID=2017437 RepID=UPI003AF4EF31